MERYEHEILGSVSGFPFRIDIGTPTGFDWHVDHVRIGVHLHIASLAKAPARMLVTNRPMARGPRLYIGRLLWPLAALSWWLERLAGVRNPTPSSRPVALGSAAFQGVYTAFISNDAAEPRSWPPEVERLLMQWPPAAGHPGVQLSYDDKGLHVLARIPDRADTWATVEHVVATAEFLAPAVEQWLAR